MKPITTNFNIIMADFNIDIKDTVKNNSEELFKLLERLKNLPEFVANIFVTIYGDFQDIDQAKKIYLALSFAKIQADVHTVLNGNTNLAGLLIFSTGHSRTIYDYSATTIKGNPSFDIKEINFFKKVLKDYFAETELELLLNSENNFIYDSVSMLDRKMATDLMDPNEYYNQITAALTAQFGLKKDDENEEEEDED